MKEQSSPTRASCTHNWHKGLPAFTRGTARGILHSQLTQLGDPGHPEFTSSIAGLSRLQLNSSLRLAVLKPGCQINITGEVFKNTHVQNPIGRSHQILGILSNSSLGESHRQPGLEEAPWEGSVVSCWPRGPCLPPFALSWDKDNSYCFPAQETPLPLSSR